MMSSQRGFIGELLHRRVPQYVGLYIAGVWMAIEIGEWLTDKFTLPTRLTAYIFVFLAVLLPSIALFAWTHGAPGKDESSRTERVFVPLNILLAVVAALLIPGKPVASSLAASVAQDTTAVSAPKSAQSQRIMAFFWRNATTDAPDWLIYGMPFLIGEDIGRASAAFGIYTPFDSSSTLEAIRQAGFERGTDEPQSVQLRIANRSQYQYFVRGAITDDEATDGLLVQYALHESRTGSVVLQETVAFTEQTLLAAVDAVSASIQRYVLTQFDERPVVQDLPAAETVSDSVAAIRHYVEARIADDIERDNTAFGEALDAAVAVDPKFAEAYALKGLFHFLQGRSDLALPAFNQALALDYRLSTESKFTLLVNRQAIQGNYREAAEVAKTWTTVEPHNERAFMVVAGLNENASLDLDAAQAALAQVREINPNSSNTLLRAATIEQQRYNLEVAEDYAQQFISAQPGRVDGLMKLGEIKQAAGKLDEALEAYQQATYLDSNALGPELGIAAVLMRLGDFARAEDRLEGLRSREMTDQQRMQMLTTSIKLHTLIGQYREAMRRMDEDDAIARRILPPLLYVVQVQAPRIMMESFVGTSQDAVIAEMNALRATMQPPWDSFLYWYDLSVYELTGEKRGFIDAFEKAEGYLSAQSNENLRVMLHYGRARKAFYENNIALARENIDLALKASQDNALNVVADTEMFLIRTSLYDLLRQTGQPKIAVDGLTQIVETYPGLAQAYLNLAQAYYELGDYAQASDALRNAEDIWSDAEQDFVLLDQVSALQRALDADA